MKILFVGDIVGSPGRDTLKEYLPKLKKKYQPHFTIVNGENAAHGKGLTEKIYHELLQAGADVLTMGNHTWDKRDIFDFIDDAAHMVRPANFPEGTPGKGLTFIKKQGKELAVINLQGRTFLPPIDCPFQKVDELIAEASKRTRLFSLIFMVKPQVKSKQWAGIQTAVHHVSLEHIHMFKQQITAYCQKELRIFQMSG